VIKEKIVRRLLAGAAVGVATLTMAGVTSAAAVQAPAPAPAATVTAQKVSSPQTGSVMRPLTACFVTTVNVPYYNSPNGTILGWVGQGQGFDVSGSNAAWRVGKLWGGDGRNVWIHSNYLRQGGSNPSNPPCPRF
jgi:hypothetical protein